ncbi:hypothetical protein DCC39_11400 [Pueribacillus theae]|uniref:UPF0316 protein DCC39_11400 n=1 Tax=Pueribacillus theae TaxID=2171751 RepID=A0A2U1JYL0_9BACI|nr:DUF2179 domain-containing protein [Pueribacillus theae]PWA10316.1 hypothetical protein DCC39_11400 [Pueribacillus theae]
MFENSFVMAAIILVINVVYVSFFTMRMILTLKGFRYTAAFVSMIEVLIYIVGLGLVLENLNQIQNIIAYAVGFGLGVMAGMKIEEKLALGYTTVHVTMSTIDEGMPNLLRENGYGVTSWIARGRSGERMVMQILTPRKSERRLYELIQKVEPKAFIISYEPRTIHGGFWVKAVKGLQKRAAEEKI